MVCCAERSSDTLLRVGCICRHGTGIWVENHGYASNGLQLYNVDALACSLNHARTILG